MESVCSWASFCLPKATAPLVTMRHSRPSFCNSATCKNRTLLIRCTQWLGWLIHFLYLFDDWSQTTKCQTAFVLAGYHCRTEFDDDTFCIFQLASKGKRWLQRPFQRQMNRTFQTKFATRFLFSYENCVNSNTFKEIWFFFYLKWSWWKSRYVTTTEKPIIESSRRWTNSPWPKHWST